MTSSHGSYSCVLADPPWPIKWVGGIGGRRRRKVDLPYKTMSIAEIAALPVAELVADDAHLYLWIPASFNRQGLGVQVAAAWGFTVSSEIIWAKPGYGMGNFPRMQHEILLVCRRGRLDFRVNDVGSVQRWPYTYEGGARAHSAKPDASIDLIEAASPGPYLELFARRARFGWDYWGDEALQNVALAAKAVDQ